MPRLTDKTTLVLLLLFAGTLFFFRLGAPGFFDADEPAYAQAAREMREGGDWVTPHFNGRPRFDKPPLFYYLIMLSDRLLVGAVREEEAVEEEEGHKEEDPGKGKDRHHREEILWAVG